MINPSTSGWIDKFFIKLKKYPLSIIESEDLFYQNLRDTGFIYGHIISFDIPFELKTKGWFKEEISKIALLNALYGIYSLTNKEKEPSQFIEQAYAFYRQMHPEGFSLFKKILGQNSRALTLEAIIGQRVQTNDNIINKNFSHLVTNALLFIDVLAFRQFLIHGKIPEKYFKKIEETIVNIVILALQVKTSKSQHDDLLIKLFEASIRYSKFSKKEHLSLENLGLEYFNAELEKKYLIDIAGMALWSDGLIENNESYFLHKLSQSLFIEDAFVAKSIISTDGFISRHKNEIPYFNYSNPVKHFYDQTSNIVIKLIVRNKNRLIKEIIQSKELMLLLAHSTRRDLNDKEKKKIKKQLLDICKTIPSLTIFLLPGGSLLLPLLIKFIPTLLPSAFNENLEIEDETE